MTLLTLFIRNWLKDSHTLTCEYIFQKNTNNISNFPEFLFRNFCKISFYEQFRIFRKIFQNIFDSHSFTKSENLLENRCMYHPRLSEPPPRSCILWGDPGEALKQRLWHILLLINNLIYERPKKRQV